MKKKNSPISHMYYTYAKVLVLLETGLSTILPYFNQIAATHELPCVKVTLFQIPCLETNKYKRNPQSNKFQQVILLHL